MYISPKFHFSNIIVPLINLVALSGPIMRSAIVRS